MTPLIQQLEDKKKGCGKMFQPFGNQTDSFFIDETYWRCGDLWNEKPLLCPKCQAEIAILEQAIAEIKYKEERTNNLWVERINYFNNMKTWSFEEKWTELLAQVENIQSQQNKNTTIPHSTCREESEIGVQCAINPVDEKQRTEVETGSADKPQQEKIGESYAKSSEMGAVTASVSLAKSPVVSNLLQKQRQEILERIYFILKDIKCNSHQFISETEECFDREWEEMLEKLNQPKTENNNLSVKENSKQ